MRVDIRFDRLCNNEPFEVLSRALDMLNLPQRTVADGPARWR